MEEVYLWLGANVMLAYPLDEAETMLAEKLSAAESSLSNCEEDLEFLREQITVSLPKVNYLPEPPRSFCATDGTNRCILRRPWRLRRRECITGMWSNGGKTRPRGKKMVRNKDGADSTD